MGRRPGPNRRRHRGMEWMADAACAAAPQELFHPVPPGEWEPVDRTPERLEAFHLLNDTVIHDYCDWCPVRAACREFGQDEPYGTWGGLTEFDRRAGLKEHRKVRPPAAPGLEPNGARTVRLALRRRYQETVQRMQMVMYA